jgi:hypothetical protein
MAELAEGQTRPDNDKVQTQCENQFLQRRKVCADGLHEA